MQRCPLVDAIALSEARCTAKIKGKLKYADSRGKNFIGDTVPGYEADVTDVALLTKTPAEKLCDVQNYLNEKGYGLLVYDAYRPKKAVQHFMLWATKPAVSDLEKQRKEKHYPSFPKDELFIRKYVCEDSGHCYGNTVDVVLTDLKTNEKLDMGACYDFMDRISHSDVKPPLISEEAYANRQILAEAMQKFGFHPYDEEFWHYSYGGKEGREVKEPMDFDISKEMRRFGV